MCRCEAQAAFEESRRQDRKSPKDKITVEGYQGYFAMDNFTYAPVPEPGTYALMIAGVLGLTLKSRKSAVSAREPGSGS